MITKMGRSKGKVFGIRTQDNIALDQFEALLPEIEALIEEHGKINLLFVVESMKGYGVKEFVADIKFAFKYWSKIERLAVVSDIEWFKPAMKIENLFTKWDEKHFSFEELDAAWQWVEE